MPKIKCEVHQCKYNINNGCTKRTIDIDGIDSRCKIDTSCSSFVYQPDQNHNYEFARIENFEEHKTDVFCDVIKCVFERGQKCYADRIIIKNTPNENAQITNNIYTHCHTFESKD
jgi:hypothetical protein